ncbi:hypothetical protein [uncultured Azohydromonas sp.]|uniref:hypothetical protein n=1 Tax=uncultured Azohydromonas sp. TaxID=487342 RepID=UPI002639845B|nr:hypothetical protein [uncultured Azohydromonas sp.]
MNKAMKVPHGLNGGSTTANVLSDAHYTPELWNPATGRWTPTARATQARLYHSAAILLSDVSMLTGGGSAYGLVAQLNLHLQRRAFQSQDAAHHCTATGLMCAATAVLIPPQRCAAVRSTAARLTGRAPRDCLARISTIVDAHFRLIVDGRAGAVRDGALSGLAERGSCFLGCLAQAVFGNSCLLGVVSRTPSDALLEWIRRQGVTRLLHRATVDAGQARVWAYVISVMRG